jgi:hypothetical protein
VDNCDSMMSAGKIDGSFEAIVCVMIA